MLPKQWEANMGKPLKIQRYFKHFLIITVLSLLCCVPHRWYTVWYKATCGSKGADSFPPLSLAQVQAECLQSQPAHTALWLCFSSSVHHGVGSSCIAFQACSPTPTSDFSCCQLCFPGTDTWLQWDLSSDNQLILFTAMRIKYSATN